jgi:riboflavin synthase
VFTGIVEELGEVISIDAHSDSAVLTVGASKIAEDLTHGASIAVNGVCLTVIGWTQYAPLEHIAFDVMGETLRRSVIGDLKPGDQVNLERAAKVDSRLDGHIVQGHVDGSGSVVSRTPGDAWEAVRFALPSELSRYVAEKGSVAVDGVSLTVSGVGDDWFEVGLIPETLRSTTLGAKAPGERVNLEVDVLAKYVERLLERGAGQA